MVPKNQPETVAEEQLTAALLWQDLVIGDEILVEHPVYEGAVEMLSPGRGYLVLDKQLSATQIPQLITESNIPGRRLTLYPHCICSYRRSSENRFS